MAGITLEGSSSPITTTAAVRLMLGISDKEFSDNDFISAELDTDLELDLNDWVPDTGLTYQAIIVAGVGSNPTAQERTDYLNLKKYSKYYLAVQVVRSMSLGFAEEISDGQNSMKRFFTEPDELIARLQNVASEAKAALLEDYSALPDNLTVLSSAGNNYDPVSDEEQA